jgi:hypothetical protein
MVKHETVLRFASRRRASLVKWLSALSVTLVIASGFGNVLRAQVGSPTPVMRVLEANPRGTFPAVPNIPAAPTPSVTTSAGLIINPTFDASVDVPTRNAINTAIAFYQSNISTPITVNIFFYNMGSGLGSNLFFVFPVSYATWRPAWAATATSSDDATAVANTPAGATNPINGGANIVVKSPNGRAVGLNTPEQNFTFGGSPCPGFVGSGCIGINVALANMHGALITAVEHEIDEVLGLGSALSGTTTPGNPWTNDLFRWTGPGTRSYSANPSSTVPCSVATPHAFLSIDGGNNNLNEFDNCANGGDYGDWITHTPTQVQDAFTNFSAAPTLTVSTPEVRSLDVLGYTIAASTVAVTVQTSPAGLQITVDGVTSTAPQSFNWATGSSHTIATTSPLGSGTRNVFANWSDGGAISHVVAPTVPTTFTASFTTQFLLTTAVSPSGGGTVGANPSSGDGFYNSGTSVSLSAFPAFGFTFNTWSGDAAGSTNPINVVMNSPKSVTANLTAVAVTGLRFVPATPCRVADTRNPNGPLGGPIISGGTSRSFTVPSSSCGIPSSALAYSLNVTVVPPGPLNFLTIWPTGQPQPPVSTLNSLDGRIKANAAIVVAGTSGAVNVFVSDPSHVILDINGYFTTPASAPSGLVFFPVTPCRVMDTRGPTGPLGGPILDAGSTRTMPVLSSSCGLPAGALAYSLNMTVVPTGALGFVTTWPTGQSQPLVSTLNDPTGTIVANAAIVSSGTGGSINVFATDQTHLIIDVNGYFAAPAAGGLLFYAVTPCRVVDTRNPPGPFGGPALNGQRDFNVLAGPCSLPGTTKAYSFNATVVPQGPLGFLTLWPQGTPQPTVSTLNSPDASIVSNAAIVPTNNGSISAFSPNTTDLILDFNGAFAP